MGLLANKSSMGLDSFVTGMTGDVQRALILVAQIFTNKFDMSDNLRNSVVFPTTSLQLRGKRTMFGSVTSRNTGIERSKVFVQMFVRSCGQSAYKTSKQKCCREGDH
jgi:hypothetical protein